MQALYACLVTAVLVLGAQPANAMCSDSVPVFAPASGEVVPRRATVYLFVPSASVRSPPRDEPIERALGVEGARFVARQIMSSPAYRVVQLELFATGEQVTVRWNHDTTAVYRVGPPSADVAKVVRLTHSKSEWTCSFQNTIDMEITGNAIAYRMDWSDGTSTVMPAGTARFFGGAYERRTPVDIRVGHLNCMGYNVAPEALATLRRFDLVALFSDGAEHTIGSAEATIKDNHAVLPFELLPHGNPPDEPEERRDVPTPREMRIPRELFNPRELPTSLYDRMVALIERHIPEWAVIAALTTFGALSASWLLSRRRDHVPRY